MDPGKSLDEVAAALVGEFLAARKTLSTAESCTGGWIAKAVTDIPGSSACFAYGIVSYSNEAKESLLGVNPATLRDHGAVSEATVREMAEGVLRLSGADFAAAVSGVAGPGGGSADKPAGTVWLSWAWGRDGDIGVDAELHRFAGGRDAVRRQSVALALQGLRDRLRAASDA